LQLEISASSLAAVKFILKPIKLQSQGLRILCKLSEHYDTSIADSLIDKGGLSVALSFFQTNASDEVLEAVTIRLYLDFAKALTLIGNIIVERAQFRNCLRSEEFVNRLLNLLSAQTKDYTLFPEENQLMLQAVWVLTMLGQFDEHSKNVFEEFQYGLVTCQSLLKALRAPQE